ncbi:hypothetical protein HY495_03045 [Candidatus Woesearchaeota archaeon]|nr:hypothetical protein [Candidatus Woesearchaeota archaeon]
MIWKIVRRKSLAAVERKKFPDAWITFIHGVNEFKTLKRSDPHAKGNMEDYLSLLRNVADVLLRFVTKSAAAETSQGKKKLLIGLREELLAMGRSLSQFPADRLFGTKEYELNFKELKKNLERHIKRAQAIISLIARTEKKSI